MQEESINETCAKRPDGKYELRLSEIWTVEYEEHPATGLWQAEIFKHDVPEWRAIDYASLEEARQAAQSYYDQV